MSAQGGDQGERAGQASSNGHQPEPERALAGLAGVLRSAGGMIATLLVESWGQGPGLGQRLPGPAQLAATGPRTSADPAEYELLIEAIYEGYLLHYAKPRIVRVAEDDLALLTGDQLYALGLARLVRLGDIAAVRELADVITLCALAHGGQRPELAQAAWQAGAVAIGWGASAVHERAKQLARAGSGDALAAMQAAAMPVA